MRRAAPKAPARRRAAPAAKPAAKPVASKPAATKPAATPAATNNTPVPSTGGGGGGMMASMASTVMQGMAFGGGSAVAHRAVDAVMGPRDHGQPAAYDGGQDAAPAPAAAAPVDPCHTYLMDFQECLRTNDDEISACQWYYDLIKQCKNSA